MIICRNLYTLDDSTSVPQRGTEPAPGTCTIAWIMVKITGICLYLILVSALILKADNPRPAHFLA